MYATYIKFQLNLNFEGLKTKNFSTGSSFVGWEFLPIKYYRQTRLTNIFRWLP